MSKDDSIVPTNNPLWEECVSEAKEKFSVYPSPYTDNWTEKTYEDKGGTWKIVDDCGKSRSFSDFIKLDEVSPPDYKLTKFTHRPDIRADFRSRYGDEWQSVLYGKAWKNFKLKKDRGEVRKPSAKQKDYLFGLKSEDINT